MDELTYILFHHMEKAIKSMYKYASEKDQLAYDNVYLRRALESKYQGNKRDVQAAKVSAGLPIARKQKKNLADLKFQMYLKLTDKQLMEYFGISKTTLWRWKKELAEREANGQMPF
jgi:DNA invertase Pin-like site-specific DNA recombinase